MRIVVLGANGQVGSRVLNRLLQDYPPEQVVGCVRAERMAAMHGAAPSNSLLPFNPFTDNWEKLGKVDVLINCIGIIRETAGLDFTVAHGDLTARMLQHRAQIGNPKLIQLSALGADPGSASKFLSTKGQADQELLQYPGTVVLRPSIVCTPGTMLSRKLQGLQKLCRYMGGFLPFPDTTLQTKLQPVAVEDLTELVSRLCVLHDHPPMVEVGGSDVYTVRELLEMVPACKRILPFPQTIFDHLSPLLRKFFPGLPDKEQQLLLQQNNVADTVACEKILGRKMASTSGFWQRELA
ncbi:Rossmann-fold NAD(P)-binding domain-containing protein [Pontibacter beigongshangensis]|uniref:hypothetical protein n=1 Tax=Pontibacter beigongshangensis TaxID=2574733 RepID=UPI0016502A69|nr:hypothetical protein [Pontibacter beigongshangensis]